MVLGWIGLGLIGRALIRLGLIGLCCASLLASETWVGAPGERLSWTDNANWEYVSDGVRSRNVTNGGTAVLQGVWLNDSSAYDVTVGGDGAMTGHLVFEDTEVRNWRSFAVHEDSSVRLDNSAIDADFIELAGSFALDNSLIRARSIEIAGTLDVGQSSRLNAHTIDVSRANIENPENLKLDGHIVVLPIDVAPESFNRVSPNRLVRIGDDLQLMADQTLRNISSILMPIQIAGTLEVGVYAADATLLPGGVIRHGSVGTLQVLGGQIEALSFRAQALNVASVADEPITLATLNAVEATLDRGTLHVDNGLTASSLTINSGHLQTDRLNGIRRFIIDSGSADIGVLEMDRDWGFGMTVTGGELEIGLLRDVSVRGSDDHVSYSFLGGTTTIRQLSVVAPRLLVDGGHLEINEGAPHVEVRSGSARIGAFARYFAKSLTVTGGAVTVDDATNLHQATLGGGQLTIESNWDPSLTVTGPARLLANGQLDLSSLRGEIDQLEVSVGPNGIVQLPADVSVNQLAGVNSRGVIFSAGGEFVVPSGVSLTSNLDFDTDLDVSGPIRIAGSLALPREEYWLAPSSSFVMTPSAHLSVDNLLLTGEAIVESASLDLATCLVVNSSTQVASLTMRDVVAEATTVEIGTHGTSGAILIEGGSINASQNIGVGNNGRLTIAGGRSSTPALTSYGQVTLDHGILEVSNRMKLEGAGQFVANGGSAILGNLFGVNETRSEVTFAAGRHAAQSIAHVNLLLASGQLAVDRVSNSVITLGDASLTLGKSFNDNAQLVLEGTSEIELGPGAVVQWNSTTFAGAGSARVSAGPTTAIFISEDFDFPPSIELTTQGVVHRAGETFVVPETAEYTFSEQLTDFVIHGIAKFAPDARDLESYPFGVAPVQVGPSGRLDLGSTLVVLQDELSVRGDLVTQADLYLSQIRDTVPSLKIEAGQFDVAQNLRVGLPRTASDATITIGGGQVSIGGTLALLSSTRRQANAYMSTYRQTGGAVVAEAILLADAAGGTVQLTLEGGSLTSRTSIVDGEIERTRTNVSISDGLFQTTDHLRLGRGVASQVAWRMTGGEVIAGGDVWLAENESSTVEFDISGGHFQVGRQLIIGPGGVDLDIGEGQLTVSSIEARGGTLTVASDVRLAETFTITGPLVSDGPLVADVITNRSRFGAVPDSPATAVELRGDYDQRSDGSLAIRLMQIDDEVRYDAVRVSGHATLAGELEFDLSRITTLKDIVPDDLVLLEAAGGIVGSFASSTIFLVENQFATLVYGPNDVRASVGAAAPGDADGNGRFDSGDLVRVFRTGHYENVADGAVNWTMGDWNADGLFDSSDLVTAFREGNYAVATTPVPEPPPTAALIVWLLVAARHRRIHAGATRNFGGDLR